LPELDTKKIIIAPYGAMHRIPFATLFDGERFLVDRCEIAIIPSVSILEYMSERNHNRKQSILAFGNPKTDFPELQHAEEEIRRISEFFPTSKILVRENANEGEIKNLLPEWNVVHFACHAEFSEKQPLQSGLFLASKAAEDGIFQVHEIFSLKLGQTSLVSLSACETGLSRVGGGDDLVGLAVAFMYAGSPSILSSLWSVDDRSTSLLMERFYENWVKKNMSRSASLRHAQIYLKTMPEFCHPFFWGAFQLTGQWD
jgi:CHAT domain-containing protein